MRGALASHRGHGSALRCQAVLDRARLTMRPSCLPFVVALCLPLALATPRAHATLITSANALLPGSVYLHMDAPTRTDLALGHAEFALGSGARVGVQALNGGLATSGSGQAWDLGPNGQWAASGGYVAVDGGANVAAGTYASLVFDFGALTVAQVAATLNYNPAFEWQDSPLPLYIAAYDRTGQLLEAHEFLINTPAAQGGAVVRGIARSSASIASFEVTGPYAAVSRIGFTSPVPLPSALWLAAGGWPVLWLRRRLLARQSV